MFGLSRSSGADRAAWREHEKLAGDLVDARCLMSPYYDGYYGMLTRWRQRLAASVRENLHSYWRRWHRMATMLPLSTKGLATLIDWGPAWCVLGVSRLHYTLATGKITSKAGAGDYARETFPARWHDIVDECLRIRRQRPEPSRYRSRFARRRAALSFLDYVIADAG